MSDPNGRMPAERKAELVEHVNNAGFASVAALSELLGVSVDTIRRDLDQLDTDGLLIRSHGGASSLEAQPRVETGLDIRARIRTEEKDTIGKLTARLIPDNSFLIMNGGTTTLAVVRQLRDRRDLTIATNNLRLPFEVSPKCIRDLYVFGGGVRFSSQATLGAVRFQSMTDGSELEIRCDFAVIGVGAVEQGGYTTSNLGEAAMMREMASKADRTFVVADSSKIGRSLFTKIGPLGYADYFVTDREPPANYVAAFEREGVTLLTPERAEDVYRNFGLREQ